MTKLSGNATILIAALGLMAVGVLWLGRSPERPEAEPGSTFVRPGPRLDVSRPAEDANRVPRAPRHERSEDQPAGARLAAPRPWAAARRRMNPDRSRPARGRDAAVPGPGGGAAAAAPAPQAEGGLPAEPPLDVNALRQTALTDPDPDERISALQSLSLADDAVAAAVLAVAVHDPDKSVRLAALQELEDFNDQMPFDAVAGAVGDSDPEVRAEALRIVGDSEDPRAVALAQGALEDPDEDVRTEAESIVEDSATAGE